MLHMHRYLYELTCTPASCSSYLLITPTQAPEAKIPNPTSNIYTPYNRPEIV